MPNGCLYSDTYFTSGISGISTRASGLCGRRIGPLHPQSTTAAAKNRNPLMAESFVVRRVTGAVPRRCCSVAPQFVVHGAACHTQLFNFKLRRCARKVITLPPPGALSKLAESSGKAVHGQGGPIKQPAPTATTPAALALLSPTANQL